jgi:hypothetical protein
MIIWFILPHLWACVVGSPRLCVYQPLLRQFRHIKVSQFHPLVRKHEYVSTLQVPVEDLHIVELLQSQCHLYEHVPYLLLSDVGLRLLLILNALEEVTLISIFHHYTQFGVHSRVLDEAFLVTHYVGVLH